VHTHTRTHSYTNKHVRNEENSKTQEFEKFFLTHLSVERELGIPHLHFFTTHIHRFRKK
jgi:hypothetical protein